MSKDGAAEQAPRRKWTNQDHYALMARIPDSNRSRFATGAARVGGVLLAMTGGYAAERFGLRGAEVVGAMAPGMFVDLRVGMMLRIERLSAIRQMKHAEFSEPPRGRLRRIGVLGATAASNMIAFGTGAAMAYGAQQEAAHDHAGLAAGVVATIVGMVATGAGEFVTELEVESVGDSFDTPLTAHRELFQDGYTLYRQPKLNSGPSPDS